MKKVLLALMAVASTTALVFTSCSELDKTDTYLLGIYSDSPVFEVSDEMTWYLTGFTHAFNRFYFADAEKSVMLELTKSEAKKRYDKWQRDIRETLETQQADTIAVLLFAGGCPASTKQDLASAANRLLETYQNTPAEQLVVYGALQTINGKESVKETNFSLGKGWSSDSPVPPINDRNHNVFLQDTNGANQANQAVYRAQVKMLLPGTQFETSNNN